MAPHALEDLGLSRPPPGIDAEITSGHAEEGSGYRGAPSRAPLRLTLTLAPSRARGLLTLFGALILLALPLLLVDQAPACALVLALLPALVVYFAVVMLVNRTRVIAESTVSVSSGPLPAPGVAAIPTEQIDAFEVRPIGRRRRYAVVARLGPQVVRLVGGLTDRRDAEYLERALTAWIRTTREPQL
jgi:hypothetical protein